LNERIRELRKTLGLTLDKFGERLGVKKAALSAIENGHRNLTDQMFKSICREFNVNENWLRTGEGEMFNSSDDECIAMIDRVMAGESEFAKNVFKMFSKLDSADWEALNKIIKKLNSVESIESIENETSLFNDVPKTAEELEKQFPPIEEPKNNKNSAG